MDTSNNVTTTKLTTLVLGPTGATGQHVVKRLINLGQNVRVITRSISRLPECARNNPNVSITVNTLMNLTEGELAIQLDGCDAVISCLGHNITFKGMFRDNYFVRDSLKRVHTHVLAHRPDNPLKYVLMSSNGILNPNQAGEKKTIGDRILLTLVRVLLPPHRDNEKAAKYLRKVVGNNSPCMEWVVVRPDDLIDIEKVTAYDLHFSPTLTLTKARQTSRINVAHCMTELVVKPSVWSKWRGTMPYIVNSQP